MRIKKKVLRKILSVFASILLLVNSFTPYLLVVPTFKPIRAQEDAQVEVNPTAEPTSVPTETPVLTPTVEITPTIEVTPVETITPTEVPTLTPTEAPSVPLSPVEENSTANSEESAKLAIPLWQANPDGSKITENVVSLNQVYHAPQNDKVTVIFTKLPDNPGKLTIKEVKLTVEQQAEIGAFSDTAYDITSDMADGAFIYNLTLPIPDSAKGKTIEVKSSETIDEVTTNAETVDESKEIQPEVIRINGLDHFTVFMVVNPSISGTGATGISWSNTNNVYVSDDIRATVSLVSGETSKNLKATGFGLSIPTDATIEGIEVNIEKSVDVSRPNAITDNRVKLVVNGTATGEDKKVAGYFNNISDDVTTYGSPTDLWGLSLTPAQVNASNFGVAYSAKRHSSGTSAQKAQVDQIQVKVYYNNPPTISISSPNGGEIFAGNSSQSVSWSASDPDSSDTLSITLEYTTDSGITYNPIASDLTNFGTYSWTIPDIDSTTVQVRATASDGSLSSNDLSDASFTIDSTPPSLVSQTVFSSWYTTDQISDFTYADDNGIASGTPVSCVISTEGTNQTCIADSVNVCDNAGNCNTSTVTSYGADIDKSTPTDSSSPTADFSSPTNQTFITWSWTAATDVISDVKHYLWNLYQDVDTWLDGGNTTDIQLGADVSGYGDGDFIFDVQSEDNAGNMGNIMLSSTITVDTVPPLTTSQETQDLDGNGNIDTIRLTFSENIDDSLLNPGTPDGWDVDGYDGESIGTGSVDDDNILILSFDEGVSYDVDSTPIVSYSQGERFSTHDLGGNELDNYSAFSTDKSAPITPTADPVGDDYLSDQSVTLTGESGAEIRYTTDGTTPTDSTGTVYTNPILIGTDTVLKAVAIDSSANVSPVMTETYGIAPLISGEASSSVTSTTATITWTTDDPSTSRVVYDTVSHSLGAGANYGYANSTVEDSTKVISHSVELTGLTAGTTYYYRTISHGSPEAVGDEKSFATSSTTTTSDSSGTIAGATTSNPSAPVCSDTKPGNAPVLLSAVPGVNSVTLTWSKASDPVSYYLMTFGTSSGVQTYGNPNVGNKDTTSYTVSGLSGGTTYYFKVRAGNGCMPGDFSNELSSTPSGGLVEGIPAGFEEGVLGEATKSAELGEEGPTPTTTVINVGMVKGIQTIAKNKFFKYVLWIVLILFIWVIYFIYKKRNS